MGPMTPIDAYLDRLLVELRGRAGDVRRVLAETEDHLRDAAAEGVAAGLSPEDAELAAVERFGPVRAVVPRLGLADVLDVRSVGRELVAALTWLGVVGLLAIGLSGVVSLGMRAVWGDDFVAGDPIGVTYTPARCADFHEYHPEAPTCRAAAASHHTDEVVDYRIAAGVLGLVGLAAWWWLRRRRSRGSGWGVGLLPDATVPVVGLVLFASAAAVLTVYGLGQLATEGGEYGPGQWLSAAAVSTAVAAWFARDVLQLLIAHSRRPTPA
jgi:hypothetical protein